MINIQSAVCDTDEQKSFSFKSGLNEADDPFAPISNARIRILKAAYSFLGLKTESWLKINGDSICLDCIGTIQAVFLEAGLDYRDKIDNKYGTGVKNLYYFLENNNAIYKKGLPEPGDIIFWDNTWDANGDRDISNDLLTHAGIVIKIEEDGTIHYLHAHISRGLIVQKMNRYNQEYYSATGEVINHAMAMNSGISKDKNPEKWTSGHLWAAYGSILDAIMNSKARLLSSGND